MVPDEHTNWFLKSHVVTDSKDDKNVHRGELPKENRAAPEAALCTPLLGACDESLILSDQDSR